MDDVSVDGIGEEEEQQAEQGEVLDLDLPSNPDVKVASVLRPWHSRTRRPHSDVWRFFDRHDDQSKSCKVCGAHFSTTTSTGALRKHLQRHFGDQTSAVLTTAQHATQVRISPNTNTVTLSGDAASPSPESDTHVKPRKFRTSVDEIPSDVDHNDVLEDSAECMLLPAHLGPKTKSRVWKYFARRTDMRPQCRYCSKVYSATISTSGLQRHIDIHVKKLNVSNADELFDPEDMKPATPKFDPSDVDEPFLKMLIQSYISPAEAEKNFATFYNTSTGKMVSRVQFEATLQHFFTTKREAIKQFLDTCSTKISLSVELWTSDQQSTYLIITAHSVSDKWRTVRVVLDCILLPDTKTIAEHLTNVCDDFNISSRISSIASGNVLVDEAVQLYREKGSSGFGIQKAHCILTAFDRCVRPALTHLEKQCMVLRQFLRPLVNLRKRGDLQHVAALLIHDYTEIHLDVPGYWVSTVSMISAATSMRSVIDDLINRNFDDFEPITVENWDILEAGAGLLNDFLLAAKDLEKTDYPPLSNVLPMVDFLIQNLLVPKDAAEGTEWVAEIAAKMVTELRSLLTALSTDLYFSGTVLDPRHKLGTIPASMNMAEFQERLKAAFLQYAPAVPFPVVEPLSSAPSSSGSPSFMSNILRKTRGWASQPQLGELDQYLNMSQEQPDVDPVEWWENHQKIYPVLSTMARDYLAIPATSRRSSQIVSKEEHVEKLRNRLDEFELGMYVCLNSWLTFDFD